MNSERFLAYFDRICETPDAIPRLRRFILDLAVRGKLVEQYPNDEPASELLKRIQAEKARLVKVGTLRKEKSLPLVAGDEAPFVISESWSWARIGTCSLLTEYGTSVKSDHAEGGVPVLKMGDIQGGQLVLGGQKKVPHYIEDLPQLFLKKYDLLYNRTNSAELVGKTGIYLGEDDTYTFASYLIRIRFLRELTNPIYVNLAMNSSYFRETQILPELQQQCGQANVNGSKLRNMMVPLPPLAEQHRIVSKVDELFAMCDCLEAAQRERESRRDRLAAASLQRIRQPTEADAPAFSEHVRFHLHHFQRLTTRPEHIQQFRQSILNFALQGRLVPQDLNDEPVSELLKRIQAERAQLIKEGRIKPQPPFLRMSSDQEPFRTPPSWQWVRFGELIMDSDAGWSPRCEGFPRSGDNWGVLKVSAVSWDEFLPDENKQLLSGVKPPESAQVKKGDFLISRANTAELVAKCVIVEEAPRKMILSDKIVRLQIAAQCNKKFLRMVNNHAEHSRSYYAEEASGASSSMKNVSRAAIYALPIPLPPLAEQCRIIVKVEELLALCDRLKVQLTTAQTESGRLLEAVLHEALAVA